jgi:hypothetical protein
MWLAIGPRTSHSQRPIHTALSDQFSRTKLSCWEHRQFSLTVVTWQAASTTLRAVSSGREPRLHCWHRPTLCGCALLSSTLQSVDSVITGINFSLRSCTLTQPSLHAFCVGPLTWNSASRRTLAVSVLATPIFSSCREYSESSVMASFLTGMPPAIWHRFASVNNTGVFHGRGDLLHLNRR